MSAKSKTTSKTSHVMGLLRKNTPEPPITDQTAASTPAEPAPSKSTPSKNPIIASLNEDASVAQEIKGALEQELELLEHPPAKAPAIPEPPAPPKSAPMPENPKREEEPVLPEPIEIPDLPEPPVLAPAPEESEIDRALSELIEQLAEVESSPDTPQPIALPADSEMDRALSELMEQLAEVEAEAADEKSTPPEVPTPTEDKQPVVSAVSAPPEPTPAPVPAAEPAPTVPAPTASGTDYYNVIQSLVEDNTEKYMKMFNLCLCPRCQADVKALALNNLPPKYVVMEPGEFVPRMTLYERQYGGSVTAQILRACNIIASEPHHGNL